MLVINKIQFSIQVALVVAHFQEYFSELATLASFLGGALAWVAAATKLLLSYMVDVVVTYFKTNISVVG